MCRHTESEAVSCGNGICKVPDLVIIREDPPSKISDIENVEVVFKDGAGYDSAKLIDSVQDLSACDRVALYAE